MALVLLIAIAYTCAIKTVTKIKLMGIQKYICRLKSAKRTTRRHSNFWAGLYGGLWIQTSEFCHDLVEQLMRLTPNKLPFYQQGFRVKRLIQTTF